MELHHFDDLLAEARRQSEPQRLLFVFTRADLPADSTAAQRARHRAGRGGELSPVMCVDKAPDELSGFAVLEEESRQFAQDWVLMFVAALSGRGGQPPAAKDVEEGLKRMIGAIENGMVGNLIAFGRDGRPVRLAT